MCVHVNIFVIHLQLLPVQPLQLIVDIVQLLLSHDLVSSDFLKLPHT